MFSGGQHLDVVWINAEQETALAKVCRPFYKADANAS